MTPAVAEARARWLESYSAAKNVVEAVLRLAGQRELLPRVFHDLAVPARAKVTAPPPPPVGAATAPTTPAASAA